MQTSQNQVIQFVQVYKLHILCVIGVDITHIMCYTIITVRDKTKKKEVNAMKTITTIEELMKTIKENGNCGLRGASEHDLQLINDGCSRLTYVGRGLKSTLRQA